MPTTEVSGTTPLRVYIVDDHAVVRRGIRSFLELQDDIVVVGEAESGEEALAALLPPPSDLKPDVVLLDLVLPGMGGLEVVRELKAASVPASVVVLSSAADGGQVRSAIQAGVNGYLLKTASGDDVAGALRVAARGAQYLDPALGALLAQALTAKDEISRLSQREREVAALVAQGLSNDAIATALFISERTARTHVSNILTKMDLSSRTQLALWAVRSGLAPDA